ncbi:HGGxSTG domain-containing protein [Sphingomonas sp. Root710]|uniref:HGGxSTG domain-containing protein n=1 Tax=Sphingomonas sp. Root710 TaxID=1736594 RepID=UPI000B28A9B5
MPHPVTKATQPDILAAAPRCGARTRSGQPCRSPAVKGNGRCRMHGGKGSGAPRGNRNAWKHGWHSVRVGAIVRYVRAMNPSAIARFAEAAMPDAVRDVPSIPAGPTVQKRKNKKMAHQPHAPEISANGSQLENALSPRGIRPAPRSTQACRQLAQGEPKMVGFENRRAAYSNVREHRKRRNTPFAGRPGPIGDRPPTGKENLVCPQTSLICAKRRRSPCGIHDIPA